MKSKVLSNLVTLELLIIIRNFQTDLDTIINNLNIKLKAREVLIAAVDKLQNAVDVTRNAIDILNKKLSSKRCTQEKAIHYYKLINEFHSKLIILAKESSGLIEKIDTLNYNILPEQTVFCYFILMLNLTSEMKSNPNTPTAPPFTPRK